MKILVTAFGSFLKNNVNSSLECMNELPSTINGSEVFKRELPVSYDDARMNLLASMREIEPDLVVSLGLAANRKTISLEKQAFNKMDSSYPDNNGTIYKGKIIDENEENYIKTQFDLEKIKSMLENKYPFILVSDNPGTYVCNTVYFSSLSVQNKNHKKAVFIHLPPLDVIQKEIMVKCLIEIIQELISNY